MTDTPKGASRFNMAAKKLTIREAAEKLGVTRQQVEKWLAAGRIPCVTLENGARMIEARHAMRKPKALAPGPKAG